MNFSPDQIILEAQRGRQWSPLVTQQFRLRHISQVWCFNLQYEDIRTGSFYFTLHLTSMSAPFYTSESTNGPHPKWQDLTFNKFPSASGIILRIWKHHKDSSAGDIIMLTWGLHLSGMTYIGNKVIDIQPRLFKPSTVIFYMFGGFFTSCNSLRDDVPKLPSSILDHTNMIDFPRNKSIFKVMSSQCSRYDLKKSYNLDKLRKLHYLEVQIKNKSLDVQEIQNNIMELDVISQKPEMTGVRLSPTKNTPQLLTMNCLNRMLQEKPTRVQKIEMFKLNKQIEIAKFRSKLLSQEHEKKLIVLRKLRSKHSCLVENNAEKELSLMEEYHNLSKEKEKLKDFRKIVLQHREMLIHTTSQLHHRKRQLLQQLLWIYPIEEGFDKKFTINGMHLPNADMLSDVTDDGISVALGYVTHILTMCSTFLQVPLRYPVVHYGSRSTVTDPIPANSSEREFPLFTKGKDRLQFTYGVYLLNKNIAQLRWLYSMNTPDLKLTLSNLLSFLQGYKEFKQDRFMLHRLSSNNQMSCLSDTGSTDGSCKLSANTQMIPNKLPPLRCYENCSHCSDPILDCLRHEKQVDIASKSHSTLPKIVKDKGEKDCCKQSCPGLSEILTIPETYFRSQVATKSVSSSDKTRPNKCSDHNDSLCVPEKKSQQNYVESRRTPMNCDINLSSNKNVRRDHSLLHCDSVEEGTDLLNPKCTLSDLVVEASEINSKNCEVREVSLNNGSHKDNSVAASKMHGEKELESMVKSTAIISKDQQEFMQNWLRTGPALVCSDKNLYPDEFLGTTSTSENVDSPLTARTDALLTTKSFNLVKPKH